MTECGIRDPLEAENHRLRNALLVMVTERKKMASQLKGVQNLGLQLQKKEQQIKLLSEKNERLEGSLARAENRVLQARNGQQGFASQGAIVTPGVSKKVLEALTRENTKPRQAFDHISSRGQSGVDLAVESRELHEIIMTLREERDMKSNEVNKLKRVLTAVENQSVDAQQNQLLHLHAQVTKLERNLNAKQDFCEAIVTKIEELESKLQSLKDGKIRKVRETKNEVCDIQNGDQKADDKQEIYKALVAENHQLRDRLSVLITQGKKTESQSATGDENLHPELQTRTPSKNELQLEKYKRLEALLGKSANRMMQMGIPVDNYCRPHYLVGHEEAIIDPDSSKKVLDALTWENAKLRGAVDHLTKKGSSGIDLAVRCACLQDVQSLKRDKRKLMEEVQALRQDIDGLKEFTDETQTTQQQSCGEVTLTASGVPQTVERELEEKEAQLFELQMELDLLKKTLAVYEDDLISEREERVQALSDREKLKKEYMAYRENIELLHKQLAVYEDDFKSDREEREKITRERDRLFEEHKKLQREYLALRENVIAKHKQYQVPRRNPRPGGRGASEAEHDQPLYLRNTRRRTDDLGLGEHFRVGDPFDSDLPSPLSREMRTTTPQPYKEVKKRKLERGHRDSKNPCTKRDLQIRGAASAKPCSSKLYFGSSPFSTIVIVPPCPTVVEPGTC